MRRTIHLRGLLLAVGVALCGCQADAVLTDQTCGPPVIMGDIVSPCIEQSAGQTTLALSSSTTSGSRTVLALPVNYVGGEANCKPDTIRQTMFLRSDGETVEKLLEESSYDTMDWSGEVSERLSLAYDLPERQAELEAEYRTANPNISDSALLSALCSRFMHELSNAANEEAVRLGYDPTAFDHVTYLYKRPPGCQGVGQGSLGGRRSWIYDCGHRNTIVHELGHNLGMHHAGKGTNEYGDFTDFMAKRSAGLNHVNAPHRLQMGWLAESDVLSPQSSGDFDLAPLELSPQSATLPQAIKIPKQESSHEYYFLSYRRQLGNSVLANNEEYIDKLHVHTHLTNRNVPTWLKATVAAGEKYQSPDGEFSVTVEKIDPEKISIRVELSAVTPPPDQPDTTAPEVRIAQPTGTLETTTTQVTVQASDDVGIARVELEHDGTPVGSLVSGPFSFVVDGLREGANTLTAIATDTSGNEARHTATVNVVLPDTTSPSVTLDTPADGTQVPVRVRVEATIDDDTGVVRASLLANGKVLSTLTTAPYHFDVDLPEGEVELVVEAVDAAGNTGRATAVVNVASPVDAPPPDGELPPDGPAPDDSAPDDPPRDDSASDDPPRDDSAPDDPPRDDSAPDDLALDDPPPDDLVRANPAPGASPAAEPDYESPATNEKTGAGVANDNTNAANGDTLVGGCHLTPETPRLGDGVAPGVWLAMLMLFGARRRAHRRGRPY